jgi:hypothetical protein
MHGCAANPALRPCSALHFSAGTLERDRLYFVHYITLFRLVKQKNKTRYHFLPLLKAKLSK